eukprot:scaffold1708_cov121-Skeletonema_marinoi.AAC.2
MNQFASLIVVKEQSLGGLQGPRRIETEVEAGHEGTMLLQLRGVKSSRRDDTTDWRKLGWRGGGREYGGGYRGNL